MGEEFKDYASETKDIPPEALYYPPPPEEKERPEIGVIRELDPEKTLIKIRHTLQGEMYNEETKKWEKMCDPLMDKNGIGKYLATLSSVVQSTVTFSNFTDKEVPRLAYHIFRQISPVIWIYYKSYGIKDKSIISSVIDSQIFMLAFSCLKKAQFAGDRAVIGRTIQEQIQTRTAMGSMVPQVKKRGFLSRLNPFG